MRISELSPDLRRPPSSPASTLPPKPPLHHLLSDLESTIHSLEHLQPGDPSSPEPLAAALRAAVTNLSSSATVPGPTKLLIWKLAYRLWNAAVDLSNAALPKPISPSLADLRHAAADILLLAGEPAGVPSPALKAASFFLRTGQIWHDLHVYDRATDCFEKSTDLLSKAPIDGDEQRRLALDLNLARARTAWELSDRNLAITLLNRSKNLLFGSGMACKTLAEQLLEFSKLDLAKGTGALDASRMLSEALDLCERGISMGKRGEEGLELEKTRGRCLRFMAAERLAAEDYEGVLKCVRVLRAKGGEGGGEGREHVSTGYVAMRAWLGMGRVREAEKELKGLVGRAGEVPEGVCVAAAEAFVAAAGVEAAPGVMKGLLDRCGVGAGAAVRVVRRVAEGGGSGRMRVVAELAADERVVALFEGEKAAKECGAMHALLWNCGAEHFRLKDYETSAELFEKSMLYMPRDEDNRARRSNCFRVLTLCHLGLSQLDRAEEFINEGEKLDPNIKCSFLKFKIYLQKKDENKAINQMQAMIKCIDFDPEFITLSTHEAIACQSIHVAISSLSFLLNLYSPGKPMPMTEVAAFRNLVTLLHREQQTEHELLKYTKLARARMVEVGPEGFFGKGAVGCRELNWFAGNSWNMGLKCGKEKKFALCAEFLEMASDFYNSITDEDDESQGMICKSLILSVGALLNVEEEKKVPLANSDIKKAIEMLSRAGKILPSVSTSKQFAGNQPDVNGSILFLHTFNTYQLLNRLDSDSGQQQLQLIKTFASLKACTSENLLQLGLSASQGARPNLEAAEFALNACLSNLLASPSPDYQIVSIVLRKLAGLGGLRNDDAAYSVYKQAYQIIVGLKDDEYPIEEGKWLAMTAWNKSGMAVRLRQVGTARKWMKMGLDLARHRHGMEKYVDVMKDCFANFEKLCGGESGIAGCDDLGETDNRSQSILQQ